MFRKLQPRDTIQMHIAARQWLTNELMATVRRKRVVVTHHAPSKQSVSPMYQDDPLTPAYASRMESVVQLADLWIHGHMHDSFDYTLGECRVVCNPRGYAPKGRTAENESFDSRCIVQLYAVIVTAAHHTSADFDDALARGFLGTGRGALHMAFISDEFLIAGHRSSIARPLHRVRKVPLPPLRADFKNVDSQPSLGRASLALAMRSSRLRSTPRCKGWCIAAALMGRSERGAVIWGDDLRRLQECCQALEPHHLQKVSADGQVFAAETPEECCLAVFG